MSGLCLCLSVLWILTAPCWSIRQCLVGTTINVILLEDQESPWSLKFVRKEVLKAIETDAEINAAQGLKFNLTAIFAGFNTSFYKQAGCRSTTCEGVGELQNLMNSGDLGCAVLGPTCTYATFQMVDAEKGLKLRTAIISAGSFSRMCDYTLNLQRLLPPARKISDFFIHFWRQDNKIKPEWKTAYVYKKPSNTEDCFWYINALDVGSGHFSQSISRIVLRKLDDLKTVLQSPTNRTSNLFIMCGSPKDVLEVKHKLPEADSSEILFILIDLYNDEYYINTTSLPSMKNVLVLTMPNNRSYVINPDLKANDTMNDFMAAYHDAVLLIGQVMRNIVDKPHSEIQQMDYVNVNYFRNTSFSGSAGTYKLDKHGDRDVNLTVIYTSTDRKYLPLFTFNTEDNTTQVVNANPSFVWGQRLPHSRPDSDKATHTHTHTHTQNSHSRWFP